MKKKYNANNLYVGRIMYTSNEMDGPFCHETDLKYIFEAKNIEKPFYEEIFTGMRIQRESTTHKDGFECKNFNTPYIIELESFLDCFPDLIDQNIYSQSILLRMDKINGVEKEKVQQDSAKIKRPVKVTQKRILNN